MWFQERIDGPGDCRSGAAASERLMEEEVQRSQVGQFEALYAALHELSEMRADTIRRHLAHQYGIVPFVERDDPDIAGVAFIAGAGVRYTRERNSHRCWFIFCHVLRKTVE